MNIVLTGATGFLGKVIYKHLIQHKHIVVTVGRDKNNHVIADLRIDPPVFNQDFDALIHVAGLAHTYPKTPAEEKAFYEVNVEGTRNALSSIYNKQVKRIVMISTVAVYGLDKGENINEQTPLAANTPYGKSKIAAEELLVDYCKLTQTKYLILRLPLVVGDHPKGNLGKMISAIKKGRYVRIAQGNAHKSMVLASDVAELIQQWITATDVKEGIYHVTDGVHPTFYQLEEAIRKKLAKGPILSIPYSVAKMLGKIGDCLPFFPVNSHTIQKISDTFTFSDSKAREELGWQPQSVIEYFSQ